MFYSYAEYVPFDFHKITRILYTRETFQIQNIQNTSTRSVRSYETMILLVDFTCSADLYSESNNHNGQARITICLTSFSEKGHGLDGIAE
jgi:hypothetical protein